MGERFGNPRTCKGLFSRLSYRLAQLEETGDIPDEENAFKILQNIIPDLVIDGRSLSGAGPLVVTRSIIDVKTLSSCRVYPDDRTSTPNAVVNARQMKVNVDCHTKAQSLEATNTMASTRSGMIF